MLRFQQIDVLGPVALLTRMERTVHGALAAIAANLVIHSNATVVAVEDLEGSDTASLILSARDTAPEGRENTEPILAQSKLVIESLANWIALGLSLRRFKPALSLRPVRPQCVPFHPLCHGLRPPYHDGLGKHVDVDMLRIRQDWPGIKEKE